MKVTIFGATGRTGVHLIKKALEAGYSVTVLARTPSKVGITHARLTVVQGNVTDATRVAEAIAGADAVLSVLGPTNNEPSYTISTGTEHIIEAMRAHGVRRLVISAGAGVADPNDDPKLINKLINVLLKLTAKYVYEDMLRVVDLVRTSNLDWIIVRVPMLTNDPGSGNVRVGYVGKGTGARLAREDMAEFMLEQIKNKTYLQKAPVISN